MTREELLARAKGGQSRPAPTGGPQTASAPSREELLAKAKGQPKVAPTAPQAPSAAVPSNAIPTKQPIGSGDFSVMGVLGDAFKETAGQAEMGLSLASSAVAEPVAGLYGLLTGGGGDAVDRARDALTYKPMTQAGQADMQDFGNAMAGVGEALTAPSEFLGDATLELTGSPTLAAAMYTLPQAAMEAGPLALGGKAVDAARLAKQTKQQRVVTEMMQDPELRVNDSLGAQWKLDKDGVAVENTTGRKLLKEDIQASDAALITNSNKATKNQMRAMTEAFNKRSVGDSRGLSPSQIIGNNAAKALDKVNKTRQAVGEKMDAFIKGPAGQTQVNIGPAMSNFYKQLEGIGIRPTVDMSTGKVKLDFRGSDLDFKTLGPAQTILEDAFQMTVQKGVPTLSDVHKMKRGLDNLLDAKKLEQGGALGNMERMVLEVRSQLNDVLKGVDGYGELNAQYADLLDGLQKFDQYRPAGVSWDSPRVMNGVGAGLRSAAADTAAVNDMLGGLQSLNGSMVAQGVPFDIDVLGLSRYNDFLNGQFTRTAAEAIPQGGYIRRARNSAQGAALSAFVGNPFGVGNNVGGLIATGVDAVTARNIAKAAKKRQATVIQALKE